MALDYDDKVLKTFGGNADHFANFTKAVRSRNAGDLHADILEGHLSSALCHLGNASPGIADGADGYHGRVHGPPQLPA